MKKPASLRAYLTTAFPDLARDPDRLLVFVDNGALRSTYAPGLSFEYAYTLHIILTDFAADPDTIMLPLLLWVRLNQPDLLDNVDQQRSGIPFEADMLDNDKCDLSIKLPLTEAVIAKLNAATGRINVSYADTPQPEAPYTATHWDIYVRDDLVASWDVPAP